MQHLKRDQKLVLFIQATMLSCIYFTPTCFCLTPNCSGEPFDCGSIKYIAYPFWGGSRPPECGRQGFEIICLQGGVPILNISTLSYQVREIDFGKNTLKVAREDLQSITTCPEVPHNTTLPLDLFEYPSKSKDQNVTLYYDCSDDNQSQLQTLPNRFSCSGKSNNKTINLFKTGDDASSGPGPHTTCKNSIFVRVNQEAAKSLANPTESSINNLQSALAFGFSIKWFNDTKQSSPPFCNANAPGSCAIISYNPRNSSAPFCTSPSYGSCIGSGSRQGTPPVESPGYPPVGEPAMGMPPVQSVGNPPESFSHYPRARDGPKARKNPAKEIVIVLPLSIAGVIVVSIIICYFLKRRHSANGRNQKCNQRVENFLLQHGSLTPKRYKYWEIKKITKSFSDKLGQGGYGSVYKGTLPNGCLVAVKVLIETDSNGEEFVNEVASISRTSHVNIVSLLGFCYEGNKRALVYEFMPNKSLDKFLSNNGSSANTECCLDLEKLYKIAVGIAKGLEYLHTGCSTRIVHFDIKPQNILLDEDFCPKISDFGLAKLCKKKQSILSVLGTRGTIGYIAPEIFSRNFGGVSHKSDVYSYGVMVLEMAGARKIFQTHQAIQSSENYFPDKIYEQVVIDVTKKLEDVMIEEEEETRRKMFLVGFWCMQTSPLDRPSISKVVEMLEGSLESIQIPPKPILFTPTPPMQNISSSLSVYVETENSAEH